MYFSRRFLIRIGLPLLFVGSVGVLRPTAQAPHPIADAGGAHPNRAVFPKPDGGGDH